MATYSDYFPADWLGQIVTVQYKGPSLGGEGSSYDVWESVGKLRGSSELGILLEIGTDRTKQHFIAYDAITSMLPGGRR